MTVLGRRPGTAISIGTKLSSSCGTNVTSGDFAPAINRLKFAIPQSVQWRLYAEWVVPIPDPGPLQTIALSIMHRPRVMRKLEGTKIFPAMICRYPNCKRL